MSEFFVQLSALFTDAWTQTSDRFSDIVPAALLAIFIVLFGWLVASLLQMIVIRILRFFAIDKLAGKTPLERLLKDIGVTKGLTDILGLLVFWLAILVTLTIASEMMNLSRVSYALLIITRYIPQAIAGLLIIVFGLLLARFLQVLTMQALKRADIIGERIIGKIVYIVVLVFVVFAAVEQLGVQLDFITTNAIIMMAATLILFGVAMITASRSLIEGWILTQYLRHHIHVGDVVEIDGKRGAVQQISAIALVIRIGEQNLTVPSKFFIEKGYTHSTSHT